MLSECCGGDECCASEHPIVTSAVKAAAWSVCNDDACASLEPGCVERALSVFALNAFGFLADGLTEGATSLYVRGAKFTHRCLSPSVVFHGQCGKLCFRSTRPIAIGEIPTISYLGVMAHCGSPRRRKCVHAVARRPPLAAARSRSRLVAARH